MVLQNNEKCYSHVCCTSFEVKRKTKSACVSKTSMPCFNGGGRRKKSRKSNLGKSKPVVSPRDTKNKSDVKLNRSSRVGKVISKALFLVGEPDVRNSRKSQKLKLQSESCRGLCSVTRNLLDASTQTLKLSPVKLMLNHSTPNYHPSTENEGIVGGIVEASPLKEQNNGCCSSKVSSWQRGSGDFATENCNSVEMKKLDFCCFPLININPPEMDNVSKRNGGNINESKICRENDDSFLGKEEDSLIGCIYQAQEKVNDIRVRLEELALTLTSRTTTPVSPKDTKHAKKLMKALDDMIKEVDAVSEMGWNWSKFSDTSPCRSIGSPNGKVDCKPMNVYVDAARNPYLDHLKPKSKSKNHRENPKKVDATPETFSRSKLRRTIRSHSSPSAVSSSSSIGKESSLTLLKKELGNFFEKMKLETDLLMEDAQVHHKALLHYSEHNSISSLDTSSIGSTGL